MLLKQTKFNEHNIKLKNDKYPPYRPIYNLSLVEVKTLKIYIKIYPKTRLIWPFGYLIGASILFNRKLDVIFICVWIIGA